jgi:hypothetical protein
MSPPIEAGFHTVVLRCPACGERADVAVYIAARLLVDEKDSALHPAVKSKGVDHKCGQIRLPEPDEDETGTRPLDFAELAAGEGVDRDR